jgi:hypothetical protein
MNTYKATKVIDLIKVIQNLHLFYQFVKYLLIKYVNKIS